MPSITIRIFVSAVFALTSLAALGQQNTVRVSVEQINVHSDSQNLRSNGPAFLTPQPAAIAIGDTTILQLVYTRKIDPHWDLDVQAGIPPRLDVKGLGTLAPFGVIAHIRQAGPTIFATYHFGAPENRFRPFAGVGLNYSRFYDAQATDSGRLVAGGPTRISLSDSFGPAAKIGASYRLVDRWSLVGTIGTARLKTDVSSTTGSIERTTSVVLRPVGFSIGVAASF